MVNTKEQRKPLTFTLPISFHARLKKAASGLGVNLSQFVEQAIEPMMVKLELEDKLIARYAPPAPPAPDLPFRMNKEQKTFLTKARGYTAQQMFDMAMKVGIEKWNRSTGGVMHERPHAATAEARIDPFS